MTHPAWVRLWTFLHFCVAASSSLRLVASSAYRDQFQTFGDARDLDVLYERDSADGFKTILQQVDGDTSARPAPDVVGMDFPFMQQFAPLVVDLYEELSNEFLSLFRRQYLEVYEDGDGRLLALPGFHISTFMYYRKDLLKKYNVSVPRTWDELERAAQIVTTAEIEDGTQMEGYRFNPKLVDIHLLCHIMEVFDAHNAGGIVEDDGTISVVNPAALRALARMASWVGGITTHRSLDEAPEGADGWYAGKLVFVRQLDWMLAPSLDQLGTDKVGIMPLPRERIDDKQSATCLIGFGGLAVLAGPGKEIALDLVKFLAGPLGQETRMRSGDTRQPTVKSLARDPAYCNTTDGTSPCDIPEHFVHRPIKGTGRHYDAVSRVIMNTVNRMLRKSISPDTALRTLYCDLHTILLRPPVCLPMFPGLFSVRVAFQSVASVLVGTFLFLAMVLLYFRKSTVVKASGASILVSIGLGSIFGCIFILVRVRFIPTAVSCIVALYVGHMGFFLIIVPLALHLLRANKIFRTVGMARVRWHPASISCSVCLLVAAYLTVWVLFDAPLPTVKVLKPAQYIMCESVTSFWGMALLVLEGLVLIASGVIAFKNRGLPSSFNQSTQIVGITYCCIVVLLIVVPLHARVDSSPDFLFFVEACSVTLLLSSILVLFYIPKLLLLFSKTEAELAARLEEELDVFLRQTQRGTRVSSPRLSVDVKPHLYSRSCSKEHSRSRQAHARFSTTSVVDQLAEALATIEQLRRQSTTASGSVSSVSDNMSTTAITSSVRSSASIPAAPVQTRPTPRPSKTHLSHPPTTVIHVTDAGSKPLRI